MVYPVAAFKKRKAVFQIVVCNLFSRIDPVDCYLHCCFNRWFPGDRLYDQKLFHVVEFSYCKFSGLTTTRVSAIMLVFVVESSSGKRANGNQCTMLNG